MNATLDLEVVEGSLKGEQFLFRGTTRVLVGRSRRCDLALPDDPLHWDVSRKHCLIDVGPSVVTICDMGSRNGTYVNGTKIGQRPSTLGPGLELATPFPTRLLHDGDLIRIGEVVFRADIRPAAGTDARQADIGEALSCAGA